MAEVVVIGAGDRTALPDALTLLPHDVRVAHQPPPDDDAVVLIIDGRSSPAAARDLCVTARAASSAPSLLLIAESALTVVQAAWGFDDIVLETASAAEFDARIRLLASLRHDSPVHTCGPVTIDEAAYTADVGNERLQLTYTEFELLKYLVLHPGRVLSRELLLSEVWGYDYLGGTRTVDVHVRRLRAKLGSEHEGHIVTVRNVGYRFTPHREH